MLERVGKYTNTWPLWAQMASLVGVLAIGTGALTFVTSFSVTRAALAMAVVAALAGPLAFYFYVRNGGLRQDRSNGGNAEAAGGSDPSA